MTTDSDIVFDPQAGISEEEQREILVQINGIAEKNRRSLSEGAGGGKKKTARLFKAKKSGRLFPAAVNVIALAVLAGGFFLLYVMQGKTDAQVRQGTKVYNSAERALIEEIRRETSSRLESKENEISLFAAKLEEVDAELQALYSSNIELGAEQQAAENRLKSLQDEYQGSLTLLQDERSRILEESRSLEASLQAELEKRTRELAAVTGENAALDYVRGELERLSVEQSQVAAVEDQLGAMFANMQAQIAENMLDDAAGSVRSIQQFLQTPAFQALRGIQSRKELYVRAAGVFEAMIDESRKNLAALAMAGKSPAGELEKTIADLQAENTLLKDNVAGLTRTVESVSSQGTGLAGRLVEQESRIGELQSRNQALQRQNEGLQTSAAGKDRSIAELETERNTLQQTVSGLQDENSRIQAGLAAANTRAVNLNSQVQNLTTLNLTLSNTVAELTAQINNPQSAAQEEQ